jgi:hypothetical protein
MSSQQQQQLIAQAQAAQGGISNSSFGDMDPRRFAGIARGGLNGKDGQPAGPDTHIGSPTTVRQDQTEYLMKVSLLVLYCLIRTS